MLHSNSQSLNLTPVLNGKAGIKTFIGATTVSHTIPLLTGNGKHDETVNETRLTKFKP